MNAKLTQFLGMKIYINPADHPPPHIHVYYGEYECVIDFQRRVVLEGELPRRALNQVLDWCEVRELEIAKAWHTLVDQKEPYGTIAPLDDAY